MQARLVDPRDVDCEVEDTVYRVYFVRPDSSEREMRVTDSESVLEVIEWAVRDAGNDAFTVYCEHPSELNPGKTTLERLLSR